MPSDLSSTAQMTAQMRGADAVIHAAGSYRIGIKTSGADAMWDANVGTTERVLDAAVAAGVPRIVYVSTVNVFGNTNGELVDETYRRDLKRVSCRGTTRPSSALTRRRRSTTQQGAPMVIVQPSQVYGPNDHSKTSSAA